MKKFLVNVNGSQYEVEVEEITGSAPAKTAAAPTATPAAQTAATNVVCPMAGNIISVNVSAGESVQEGDTLLILEAMKMENEIVAPKAGKVAAVNVTKGAVVNSGDVLVVIE